MAPETTEVLKNIGQALGFIVTVLTGVYGGRKLEKRKSYNDSHKYVPQGECTLRHQTESERWQNIITIQNEMKQDIRGINKQITLMNVSKK